MIKFPPRAPWARAMAGMFKVIAARMMGVHEGVHDKPKRVTEGAWDGGCVDAQ